jgi:hypothetical protein
MANRMLGRLAASLFMAKLEMQQSVKQRVLIRLLENIGCLPFVERGFSCGSNGKYHTGNFSHCRFR